MPPKKKPAEKKAPTDVEEYDGPNIYKELLVKQVPQLVMDLDIPVTEILK